MTQPAVTRAEAEALSHLSYTLQEILAWNKEAAGAKIPMSGSPFPSASRGHSLPQKNGWQQHNKTEPCSKVRKAQPNHFGLQTGKMPSGSSEQYLTPVPSKLSHLALGVLLEGASTSWGEQSAHRTRNTWEPDTLHRHWPHHFVAAWALPQHGAPHWVQPCCNGEGVRWHRLQWLTMSDGCLFMRASNVPLQMNYLVIFFPRKAGHKVRTRVKSGILNLKKLLLF